MKTLSPLRSALVTALVISLFGAPMIAGASSGYYTQGGKIYDAGGQELQVRGISHFGFNKDQFESYKQYAIEVSKNEQKDFFFH